MSKTIGILTSGGDAPGMNAAIRAIILTACKLDYACIGFHHGYNGLIDGDFRSLTPTDTQDIIQRGGTILKSARCPQMHNETGVQQAVNTLYKARVDILIVIGGDGSFSGLIAIAPLWKGQVIGIPGTIDNDIDCTDFTIGFSTAVNTAIDAIDKIRDTANAFDRVFIVEVMGRHSGHIAFNVGIATAAEHIVSFENYNPKNQVERIKEITEQINKVKTNKVRSFLIVIAENLWQGGISALAQTLKQDAGIDSATCILGHTQRGGSPVAKDRILATKLGIASVVAAQEGKTAIMVAEQGNEITYVPLQDAIKHTKSVEKSLVDTQKNILSIHNKV